MLNLLKRSKKKSHEWGVDEENMIVHAFTSGGIDYYMFKEAEGAYCMRALSAMSALEEMNMRVTREYLLAHVAAMDQVFSDPSRLKMNEVFQLHNNLKERLNFIVPTEDLIWRMCSVAFFDKQENPKKYDPDYGLEKIKRWKQDNTIPDFFLSIPIKDILNLPTISVDDLETCLKLLNIVDKKHTKDLLSLISLQEPKSDTISALLSQKSLQSI